MIGLFLVFSTNAVHAEDAAQLDSNARAALNTLYASTPAAKALGEKAVAILVFPSVTKAGLGVGGQFGEGVLLQGGKTIGYFNSAGASVGLQAGIQTYRYAMFFMSAQIFEEFKTARGFEIGVGPTVVIVDSGMAKNFTTATVQADIYAFVFGQKGLMAGFGLQGTKITKIEK
ncbi:MAG TPA: lipid-binding SYLF domain-containing protein [Burkholderiales bacterium]|nr:lipid-binding SYLF domain-containing protein [Burkholderiales bacterium]